MFSAVRSIQSISYQSIYGNTNTVSQSLVTASASFQCFRDISRSATTRLYCFCIARIQMLVRSVPSAACCCILRIFASRTAVASAAAFPGLCDSYTSLLPLRYCLSLLLQIIVRCDRNYVTTIVSIDRLSALPMSGIEHDTSFIK